MSDSPQYDTAGRLTQRSINCGETDLAQYDTVGRFYEKIEYKVRTGCSSIFPRHPLRQVAVILFYSSFYSNHPGGKQLVSQGIESIPSPNEQRRPLPSLLSLFLFYGGGEWYTG